MEIGLGFNPTPESSLERASVVAEKAVHLDPASGYAHSVLGWILYLMGDVDRAIRETDDSIRLAPNHSEIVGVAASVLSGSGDYQRSMELFERIREINPMYSPWINWVPANYYTIQKEHVEALAWLERTASPWDPNYHIRIAAARCALGDVERGQAALEKALELDPEYGAHYWPIVRFWWKGKGLHPLADIVVAGLAACGWDMPPDAGQEASAVPQ